MKMQELKELIYQGEKFSEAVKMMVNRIKELGPAPLKEQLDAEN